MDEEWPNIGGLYEDSMQLTSLLDYNCFEATGISQAFHGFEVLDNHAHAFSNSVAPKVEKTEGCT